MFAKTSRISRYVFSPVRPCEIVNFVVAESCTNRVSVHGNVTGTVEAGGVSQLSGTVGFGVAEGLSTVLQLLTDNGA
jgi:hypothetical protein